tara:strand:- start:27 stop:902 length:876 start_codon:yes stop_codon:yes gene_type:complete
MKNELTTINSLAMARFYRKTPSTSQKLKATSEEVAHRAGALSKVTRTFATTLARKGTSIGKAASLINSLGKKLSLLSLPCPAIKGASYVKAEDIEKVIAMFDEAERDLELVKRDIIHEWPMLVAHAKCELGDLADEIEYPEPEEFVSGYQLELEWLGIPAPVENTVLENVSAEASARVRAGSAKAVQDMMFKAHGRPVQDLVRILAESVDAIRNGKRLRQERFDNINEAVSRVEKLNWLSLPELKDLVRDLREGVEVSHAPSLTKEERAEVASAVDKARHNAEATLSTLGI